MNTNAYRRYLTECKKSLQEDHYCGLSFEKIDETTFSIFHNINKIKKLASDIKSKFINNISDNLVRFEKNFTENGGNVHWCIAYTDFVDKLLKLLDKNKVTELNCFYSDFMEELGLNHVLKENEIAVNHDSNDVIVFSPKFGVVNTGSVFLDFDSSLDMEQIISSKLKIFILPINDFILKSEDVEIFSYLYSIYKNAKDYPYLSSLYTPQPLNKANNVHVFLVDNGRSNILSDKDIRQSLNCISCGACKQVCPVYNVIGDKPYDNIFSGPYSNVVLPFLENPELYKHLCFSCMNCGNCTKICPVNIPIADLIIHNKNYFYENSIMDVSDVRLSKALCKTLSQRKLMNSSNMVKRFKIKMLVNNSKSIREKFIFSKYSFNQQFLSSKEQDE